MKMSERDNNNTEILPNDVSLLLARELSARKYVYHNIHLETALSYKEDCDLLKWHIPSSSNKQKVKKFELESRRNCRPVISSTGTVNISIGCTPQPYEFHTPSSLVTFFASCGQIWNLLQLETDDRLTVVLPICEWNLQRFDYNKDISIKELESKHSTTTSINWSSKGILKVKYLGTLFQIYCKPMPEKGECLRVDGHYTTTDKKKAVEMVGDIATAASASASASETVKKHPFTTAEELLLRDRGKV